MLKIEILDYTKKPLSKIGNCSKECYNTQLKDDDHARRIGVHCLSSGHLRNMELAKLTIKITASARVIREVYTHIAGAPTRLQASTRYITYENFNYYIPNGLNKDQENIYTNLMETIEKSYHNMKQLGVNNDITGYMLPLAMESTMILDCNARMLENMFSQRECLRALEEFRILMNLMKKEIANLDYEWQWISDNFFKRKCEKANKCLENNNRCPLYKKYES